MELLKAIFSRKSVRQFSDRTISQEDLHTILAAGMSGPSCVNARDWAFVVVRDKERLAKMAQANGDPARPLLGADTGILICADLERAFSPARDYWIVDGAIAGQNMLLAAQALGIGGVWLGTWPQMDRVQRQTELFQLPKSLVPHSILALGYPVREQASADREARWEPDRVHWEEYGNHSL